MTLEAIGLFFAGLAVLVGGAELVVRGAARLARSLGISPLVLGLTVVSVGTSTPELAVGITANAQGSGGLAVGNIAGTNVLNILFILGLSALLRPLALHLQTIRLDLPVMLVAAAAMLGLAWDGRLSRLDGALMLAAAIAYTVALVQSARRESRAVKQEFARMYRGDAATTRWSTARVRLVYGTILVTGIVLSVLGADWLVGGAVDIARSLGVSDATIGLTIVAIGTSGPELVTTVIATLKDERDVAVGNLLGSSIYNVLVILALTCLASPGGLPVERQLLRVDIPLMAAVALVCVPVFVSGRRVSRLEGGLFVGSYLGYLTFVIVRA